jgi:hypothetical protein
LAGVWGRTPNSKNQNAARFGSPCAGESLRLSEEKYISRPEEQGRQALLNLYRSLVLEQPVSSKIEISLGGYFRENIPLSTER